MEIRIQKEELQKAVSRLQSVIEKRSNMPILSMILISTSGSQITLSATDLEISIQQKLSAQVVAPGSIAIPGRKLFEILKESKNPLVQIREKENNRIFLSDDQAKFNLASLSAEEYPAFTEPEGIDMLEIDSAILREMINKTIYAVTLEEAGFKLSGIYTEKVTKDDKTFLRMVSTDGHRLSLIDKEVKNIDKIKLDAGVMIPKKGMSELNKLAGEANSLLIGFRQNNCVARGDDAVIVIRLLETKFPDYHAVIPKRQKAIAKVVRQLLLDGMKKMSILANDTYRGVKFTIDKGYIELVSINPDLGDAQERLEADFSGESIEAGFNSRYFIDVLQSMESEIVELGFIDNSSPCVIRGKDDVGFMGLVMPMRI
ncbi:MAG: DNA polymerase III subunit beta [Deltaproteobacteria bacterium]|nr:DNA polymerase III subunit beta [Deltaproteobacteria bacterium]